MKKPDLDRAFSCGIKISAFGDMEAEGKMSRLGTGMWEMELSSPQSMAGICLSYDESGVKTSLGELSLDIPVEKINDKAVFRLIFGAVDNFAAQNDAKLSETAGGLVYSGETCGHSFTMLFDKETAELLSVDFPENNITVSIIELK